MRVLLLLSAVLCLTSCSAVRPLLQISEPTILEVPGPTRYVAVDPVLTTATPKPATPVPLCVAPDGAAVLCEHQIAWWKSDMEAALDACNADKAAVRKLGERDGDR